MFKSGYLFKSFGDTMAYLTLHWISLNNSVHRKLDSLSNSFLTVIKKPESVPLIILKERVWVQNKFQVRDVI